MKLLSTFLLVLALAAPASAQQAGRVEVATANATLNAADESVSLLTKGNGSVAIQITGSFTATISFEATVDGSTWVALKLVEPDETTLVSSASAAGIWAGSASGFREVRARASAHTTGDAVVTIRVTPFGGGSGGGGAGSSFDGVLKDASGGDDITDTTNDALRVNVVAGSASGTTDADDASIAAGQTGLGLGASLSMAYDGSVWRRITFGTAGTASSQVFTVQGIASMTPLSSNLFLAGSAAAAGSGVNGSTVLRVNEATDSGLATDTAAIRTAVESSSTSLDNIEANLSADAVQGNAVIATGPQKMLEAKDQDGSALPNSVTEGQAVRAAGSLYGVQYAMLVNEDGSAVGSVAQSGTWTVQPGNTANTTPWLVAPNAATSGGCTPGSIISAASVNETEIKGSAGQLYMLNVTNIGSAAVYLKLYNDTAANTDETDTPILRFVIPGATTGAGNSVNVPTVGIVFSAGITFRLTGAIADNSTTAVNASEVLVSYCFK